MKIEQIQIEKLIPYAKNARKHDDAQIAQIAGSIREFGFNNPVLIDNENGIIAGHGRVLAGHKLELKKIPCIKLGHLNDTQKRAYILADNRLTETGGGWDMDMLKIELGDLEELDVDLEGLGFGADFDLGEDALGEDALNDDYTHKVDAPVYEPRGDRPPIAELTNHERAGELITAIKAANLPPDVALFLTSAAARHVVFDYGKIAEFYCHADKQTQALMEDSALVIIDFKKAMQLGYVKLKQEIADALESEQEGDDEDE